MSMLEQAIIDAKELREAAIRTAQNAVLEKNAQQIKERVNKLLEQEDEDFGMEDLGLGGDAPLEKDPLADNLPLAATDGENLCPCPEEDEEVEIDFDELRAQVDQEVGGMEDETDLGGEEELMFEEMENLDEPDFDLYDRDGDQLSYHDFTPKEKASWDDYLDVFDFGSEDEELGDDDFSDLMEVEMEDDYSWLDDDEDDLGSVDLGMDDLDDLDDDGLGSLEWTPQEMDYEDEEGHFASDLPDSYEMEDELDEGWHKNQDRMKQSVAWFKDYDKMKQDIKNKEKSVKTSKKQKVNEQENNAVVLDPSLGAQMHDYHMGMGDPVYQVGSLAYARKPVPVDLLEQAVDVLSELADEMPDDQDLDMLVDELITHLPGYEPEGDVMDQPGTGIEDEKLGLAEAYDETDMDDLWGPHGDVGAGDIEDVDDLTIRSMGPGEEEPLMGSDPFYDDDDLGMDELMEMLEVDYKNVPNGWRHGGAQHKEDEAQNAALAALQDDERAEETKKLKKALGQLKDLREQVSSLKTDKNKFEGIARKAVEKLEEINLANAKLTYMNRILENASLNERQKRKLVETISKVGSVEEAKVAYELVDSIRETKEKTPNSLNEAIARRNRVLRSQTKTEKAENPAKKRMQALAGIIKN